MNKYHRMQNTMRPSALLVVLATANQNGESWSVIQLALKPSF